MTRLLTQISSACACCTRNKVRQGPASIPVIHPRPNRTSGWFGGPIKSGSLLESGIDYVRARVARTRTVPDSSRHGHEGASQ